MLIPVVGRYILGACPGSREKTEEKEKRSSEERQKDDKYFQTIAAADPEKTHEMSTTEALRTQVDNLWLEIQQLQVENVKLKSQVTEGLNEPSESASTLEVEVEDLRQRLHEAQEREVNSEQRVQDLEEEHEAAKVTLADLQEKQKMISQETLQLREQCSNYVKEIERLNGACELAVYRALEKERNKWEEREARWLSEYSHRGDRHDETEATRPRGDMSERAGIPTSAHSMSSSPSATASAQLSPVAFSMNVQEDSTRAVSVTAGLPGHMEPLVTADSLPGRSDATISASAPVDPVRLTYPVETTASSLPAYISSGQEQLSSSREWDPPARTRGLFDYPVITPVSYSAALTQVLGMSSLSVTAAPFLSSGTRSVGVLPSQGGVHTTGLDGHRVSWSMS